MEGQSNTEILKMMNVAFKNKNIKEIEREIDSTIRIYLEAGGRREEEPLSPVFATMSSYLKMIISRKLVNPNWVLSSIIKHSRAPYSGGSNHIGLFLIGMVLREGANPNVNFMREGYGNLHILAWMATVMGTQNPDFYPMAYLLRMMGSDINRPAIRFEGDSSDVDVRLIEKSFEVMEKEENYLRAGMTVQEYLSQYGYSMETSIPDYLNAVTDEELFDLLIASDDVTRFRKIIGSSSSSSPDDPEWEFIRSTMENNVLFTRFLIELSTASADNIMADLTEKKFPLLSEVINGQSIPLYAATVSNNREMFELFIRKASPVKYATINAVIGFYKIFKNNDIRLYEANFNMLSDAVKIGADIDLYQFNFFVSVADYEQIEAIRKDYENPKWKKLCSVKHKTPRQDLRQIAFNLNLDYNMSEEKICNKLKQISIIGEEQYLESAIKRQQERIALDLDPPMDMIGREKSREKSRCSAKSMVLKNPYAYNDARIAFYKDPKDGEVWCFTSDTFSTLISSKVNPYNGEELPVKFIETLRSQLNTLKEIGVYETNTNIKDALREVYGRSTINNKKTDLQYETIIKILSIYGVSQERFESLRSETLKDTILDSIAGVNLVNFSVLPPVLKLRTTTRILYSLSKNSIQGEDELSKGLFDQIARAISGPPVETEEEPYEYGDMIGGNY